MTQARAGPAGLGAAVRNADPSTPGGIMLTIDLSGQTAVVTGASRGIGLAVTRALAGSGAKVIAGALHSSPELGRPAAEAAVQALEVDLARPDGPAELVALAGGKASILVNNVGGAPPRDAGFLRVSHA